MREDLTLSKERKYDFAGWVTKNDIRCSDGVTIKHDAFRQNDGQKVPLVWNHNYNQPNNILGHVILHNKPQGVYGYGYFNETQEGTSAKELVKHGDISSMSIGARKIKKKGSDVVHGLIYEVSLVLAAANPGANIETIMAHGVDGEESIVLHTGNLIHSADDVLDDEDDDTQIQHKQGEGNVGKTIGEILDGMTEEQQEAVYALVGMAADEDLDDEDGGEGNMKQNVFNGNGAANNDETLKHSINETLVSAIKGGAGSLKEVLETLAEDGTLQHGINSIEMLFPEAAHSTNGNTPILYKDPNTAYSEILSGTTKSPFARIKTTVADLTEDEARAKGYIKGNMKKEEFFSLIKRMTTPTTVYKKQKLDRDDIIDITDFDVVSFMRGEMRLMLEEEIARAILVGDGREVDDDDKINETNIRPIISDHEFFTIKKKFAEVADIVEAIILAMAEYRGSGLPTMYIDPVLLAQIKLLKSPLDGRYLFGDIPSDAAIAARLGLKAVKPTTFMSGKGAIIVNLSDYTVGSAKGGQLTNFDDFDIDFNQYKYLIETRLCGALTMPKSAIYFKQGNAVGASANNTQGGMTYGKRQADKVVTPEGQGE